MKGWIDRREEGRMEGRMSRCLLILINTIYSTLFYSTLLWQVLLYSQLSFLCMAIAAIPSFPSSPLPCVLTSSFSFSFSSPSSSSLFTFILLMSIHYNSIHMTSLSNTLSISTLYHLFYVLR